MSDNDDLLQSSDGSSDNVCSALYSSYPPAAGRLLPAIFAHVGLGALLLGLVYFCSAAVTLLWIRQQRRNALLGMEGAAKHVIFPIYLPMMLLSALSDLLVGAAIFLVDIRSSTRSGGSNRSSSDWWCVVAFAAAFSLQHLSLEGTALLLSQYGCGVLAVRRAAILSGSWALFTFGCVLFVFKGDAASGVNLLVYFLWNLLLLGGYLLLWLAPSKLLFRRPAARFYAKFFAIYELLLLLGLLLQALGSNSTERAVGDCVYLAGAIPFFVIFKPFVLYQSLLMDSRWWQGVMTNNNNNSSSSSSSSSCSSSSAAAAVAAALDGNRSSSRSVTQYRSSDYLSGAESEFAVPADTSAAAGELHDHLHSNSNSSNCSRSPDSSGQQSRSTSDETAHQQQQQRGDRYSYSYQYAEGSDGEGYYSPVRVVLSSSSSQQQQQQLMQEGQLSVAATATGTSTTTSTTERSGFSALLSRFFGGSSNSSCSADYSALQQQQQQQQRQQKQEQRLTGPLAGIEVGFSEAQALANEVDSIRRQGHVKLLNFAYLSLDCSNNSSSGGSIRRRCFGISSGTSSAAAASSTTAIGGRHRALLGSGSFSKVYRGSYKRHAVAIKMLFTQDLNPDVIRRCTTEARILSAVCPHPNVVDIFGVAVLPPSVCLVLEICEFGSLADILRGSLDFNPNPSTTATAAVGSSGGGGGNSNSNGSNSGRPPLCLSYADRLFLALGCARGVQALHDYSPSLCHRDIKSFNFLIDSRLNAKIADLDLGQEDNQLSASFSTQQKTATAVDLETGSADSSILADSECSEDTFSTNSGSGQSVAALNAAVNAAAVGCLIPMPTSTTAATTSAAVATSAATAVARAAAVDETEEAADDVPIDSNDTAAAGLSACTEPLLGADASAAVTAAAGSRIKSTRSGTHRRRRQQQQQQQFVMGGSNMCIYWQAPEVLRGEVYTQKSDIHSLTMVLWEIVSAGKRTKYCSTPRKQTSNSSSSKRKGGSSGGSNGSVLTSSISFGAHPYADCGSLLEVREKIVGGERPHIPSSIPGSNVAASAALGSASPKTRGGGSSSSNIGSSSGSSSSSGSDGGITCGMSRQLDARIRWLLSRGWHPNPQQRPDVGAIVQQLECCWLQSMHEIIRETPHLVDIRKIEEENFKLTILQDNFLGQRSAATATSCSNNNISNNSNNSNSGSRLKSSTAGLMHCSGGFLSSAPHQLRKPPSPEVLASLLQMQQEPRWQQLEDAGAYLIVTARRPFFMLWGTRKWTQLSGYLVNECIAHNVSALLGPQSQFAEFDRALCEVAQGFKAAQHLMLTVYRRDGKPLSLSVHVFPVYHCSSNNNNNNNNSQSSNSSSEQQQQQRSSRVCSGDSGSSGSLSAAINATSELPPPLLLPGRDVAYIAVQFCSLR